jgi:5'-deoxynucleotidase YfbR-like HD superfamily hydrolase
MNVEELLHGRIRGMSHIRRYSSFPVIRPENVAEHSFYAAYTALQIGRDCKSRGFYVDLGRLSIRALSHDIEESMTGDVLRLFKYSSTNLKHEMDEATKPLMTDFATQLFIGDDASIENFYDDWANAKDPATLEGQIVKLVDYLCCQAYIVEEYHSGNRALVGELRNVRAQVSTFAKVDALKPVVVQSLAAIDKVLKNDGNIPEARTHV